MTYDSTKNEVVSRGHWDIKFRPVDPKAVPAISAQRLQAIVSTAANDTTHPSWPNMGPPDDGLEQLQGELRVWVDHGRRIVLPNGRYNDVWFIETWQFNVIGDFSYLCGFAEDWPRKLSDKPVDGCLYVTTVVEVVCNVFEFLRRLTANLYSSGAVISIRLNDTGNRLLNDSNHPREVEGCICGDSSIVITESTLSRDQLIALGDRQAVEAVVVDILGRFGCHPGGEQISRWLSAYGGTACQKPRP